VAGRAVAGLLTRAVAGLLTEPPFATEGLPLFLGPLVGSRRGRETRAERAVAGLLTEPPSATEGLPLFLGPLVKSRRGQETRAERAVAGLLTEPPSATEGLPLFLGPLVKSRRGRETRAERGVKRYFDNGNLKGSGKPNTKWIRKNKNPGGNIRGASGPGRHPRGANDEQLTTRDDSELWILTQHTVPLMVASEYSGKRSFVCHPGTYDGVDRTSFHPSDTSNTAKPTLFRPCHTYQINNHACVRGSDTYRTAKMVIVWLSGTYDGAGATLVCFRAT